jgi:hypothetical protein
MPWRLASMWPGVIQPWSDEAVAVEGHRWMCVSRISGGGIRWLGGCSGRAARCWGKEADVVRVGWGGISNG